MLFRISRQRKIIANGNLEQKLSKWVSIDGCQTKKGAWVDQKSLNIVLTGHFVIHKILSLKWFSYGFLVSIATQKGIAEKKTVNIFEITASIYTNH